MVSYQIVQQSESGMTKGQFVGLCVLIIIWSMTVFLVGMSYSNPRCEIEVFRSQTGDELVTVCVINND